MRSTATLRMTEADWQKRVMATAILKGWRVVHIRPAQTERGWRTAYEGHPGLPDLVLAHPDRGVHLVELKSDNPKTQPTPDQRAWLAAAGDSGHLWRPADWPDVLEFLSHYRRSTNPEGHTA
jgi:hypothetical protein